MGDDQPRYALRPPSPKKAPAGAPPPLPARIPSSPKRFTSTLGRAQSTLPLAKGDGPVDQPSSSSSRASSSAFRKLSFGSTKAQTASTTNILGALEEISSTEASGRSLRNNATFFSLSTSSFIPRVRSSTCLPVAPLPERAGPNRTRAVSQPTPQAVASLSRSSKIRLEPLSTTGEQAEESEFRLPPPPPRRAISNPTPTVSGGLQPSGLSRGLSRSLATTRLQPAAQSLLQEEETHLQDTTSAGTAATGVAAEQPEEKRSVPPPLLPRRTLTASASVACLRQDGSESSSRPSAAVRVRPPSPVRIAKSNSGLLRSYSSVVIGVKPESDEADLPVNRVLPPPSPSRRSKTSAESRLSTTIVIPHKEEKNEAPTPRQQQQHSGRLTPSGLRKCQTFSTLVRSERPPPIHSRDERQPEPSFARRDTVVVQPEPAIGREEEVCGPPPSPITRGLKRRLQSGADSAQLEEGQKTPSMKIQLPAPLATSTPIATMPSASFFLRDDVAFVTPEGGEGKKKSKKGGGSGSSASGSKSRTTPSDETTPKHTARRSKKMRRLEMESGEVEEEARSLAFDDVLVGGSDYNGQSSLSPTSSRPHAVRLQSMCKVMTTSRVDYATPTSRTKTSSRREEREEEDVEMGEGSSAAAAASVTPLRLPPAPDRSALRRGDKRQGARSIRFEHVDVFLFGRTQAFASVPTTGEICLGMEEQHHDKERHWLDGREEQEDDVEMEEGGKRGRGGMEEDEEDPLSDGEIRPPPVHFHGPRMPAHSSPRRLPPGEKYTTRVIEPLSAKARSRMLRTSGVKIARESSLVSLHAVIPEHEGIRQRRRECGCSCEGGRCRPESCECALEGIPCQVDTEEGPFPCRCRADTCQNDQGRVEFNPQHVYEHYQRTFARLKLAAKMGTDSLSSPSLIRFPDEDDDRPRHNATSYLATPPPAVYQSPTLVMAPRQQPATPTTEAKIISSVVLPPGQPCTPPMQQLLQQAGGGAASAAGVDASTAAQQPPHARFPVTPVYKKYAGGGEKSIREVPLSRMAIFKAASTASVPSPTVTPTVPSDAPDVIVIGDSDHDESMDTSSVYATPPEGQSPANQPATSPRKFAAFQSLI